MKKLKNDALRNLSFWLNKIVLLELIWGAHKNTYLSINSAAEKRAALIGLLAL